MAFLVLALSILDFLLDLLLAFWGDLNVDDQLDSFPALDGVGE